MTKVLSEYKGVILLLVVLIVISNMLTANVNKLEVRDNNSISYYEK